MNELQISLIALAVVVVVGLGLYNWLQERKFRKQWMGSFGRTSQTLEPIPGVDDIPADEEAQAIHVAGGIERSRVNAQPISSVVPNMRNTSSEPHFHEESLADVVKSMDYPSHVESMPVSSSSIPSTSPNLMPSTGHLPEPLLGVEQAPLLAEIFAPHHVPDQSASISESHDSMGLTAATEAAVSPGLPLPPIDTVMEYGVAMYTLEPVPSAAFTALIETRGKENQTVRWLGFAANQWVDIHPWRKQSFTDIAVGMQLADRHGVLNAAFVHNILDALAPLTVQYQGVLHREPLEPALERAAQLDRFCIDVDVLIGLNIVGIDGKTFLAAAIAKLAQEAGMLLHETGVFHRYDAQQEVVYTLSNQTDLPFSAEHLEITYTHGITLLFEVPRVENGAKVFEEMAQLGAHFAQCLGGRLVDDNLRTLTSAGIANIQAQLLRIYAVMDEHDVPAGGLRAKRLFN